MRQAGNKKLTPTLHAAPAQRGLVLVNNWWRLNWWRLVPSAVPFASGLRR